MPWREQHPQGDLVSWDEPKTIEGKYLGAEPRTTKLGENLIHSVNTDKGIVKFFGTTMINDGLDGVTIGTPVQVEYTGRAFKTQKGFTVKEFAIRIWEPDGDHIL